MKEFFGKCKRRWWWFVVSVAACMVCAFVYVKTVRPIYTRYAAVMIKEDTNSKASSFQSQMSKLGGMSPFSSSSDVQNEIIFMQSPDISLEVVKRLELDYNYSRKGLLSRKALYGQTLPVRIKLNDVADEQTVSLKLLISNENVVISEIKTAWAGEKIEDKEQYTCAYGGDVTTAVGAVHVERVGTTQLEKPVEIDVVRTGYYVTTQMWQSRLSFTLVNKQASVIGITCNDEIPQRAEDVLNTIISAYNESWVRDKNTLAVSTSEFINERIKIIEKELGTVDSNISSLKSSNQMVDMAQANLQALGQTASSETALRNLTTELYMIDYIIKYIQSDPSYRLLPTGMGISNSAVQTQIAQYNTLVLQRNSIVQNSSERNRLVLDIDEQLAGYRDAILLGLSNDQIRLKNSITAEQGNIATYERKITNSPLHERDLLTVERQQKVKEALYIYLLQKREENELSQTFTAYNTRLVTTPKGSMVPSSPKTGRIYALAFLLGFFIPLLLIYLRTVLNTKLRGKSDLDGLNVPYIGEIPYYSTGIGQKMKALGVKIFFEAKSRKPINEAIRVVRTNMEFMLNNQSEDKKVVMITSFNPASGKSMLLANIAASEAQKGKRVVIVDFDMRRSSASNLVGNPDNGISNYIAGFSDKCPEIKVEGQENLFVIPVGVMPPNPTELLYNPRVTELMEHLRREYDYIFLDCPPVDIVADTSIIAKWADMTIFVARVGLLERSHIPEVQKVYDNHKFNNMCLLLNGTKVTDSRYGYGYGYGSYYEKK